MRTVISNSTGYVRKKGGKVKGWMISRWIELTSWLEYRSGRILPSTGKAITRHWDAMAPDIHAKWGRGNWDFPLISDIIHRYQVRSVLDIGCGSGRLFLLYHELGLTDTVGVDISNGALEIARRDFPDKEFICSRLEDIDFPAQRFDLAISNRVLMSVPARAVKIAIQKLCHSCKYVYVNEKVRGDADGDVFFIQAFDYPELFGAHGYKVLETGKLDQQTWFLFGAEN